MKNYILISMDMQTFEEHVLRFSSPNRDELQKMADFLTLETDGKVMYYISEVEVFDTALDMVARHKELRRRELEERGIPCSYVHEVLDV